MVLTWIASVMLGQGPVFIGNSPGDILPVISRYATESVDPERVAGLLRIESKFDFQLRYNAVPPPSETKHFLGQISDSDEGSSLIAIPFATEEKYRNVTLHFGREKYELRLPLAKAKAPALPKPLTKKVGAMTVTAAALPWRFTTAPRLTKISAKNDTKQPALVGASWVPQKTKGSLRDTLMGSGEVRLLDGGQSAKLALYDRREARTLEIKALRLQPAPIKLAVSGGTSTVPFQCSLNGKLIYNRYHKLSADCGFVALQVKNLYLSNLRIRNRPAGNLPSYTTMRGGDTVSATGFRAKSKTPDTGRLNLDAYRVKSVPTPGYPRTMIYLTER